LSMVISVLSAAPGSSPALPGEAILHLAAIIGWSFAGAMLLSIGITLVLSTSTSE
jgi:hypothetical protein